MAKSKGEKPTDCYDCWIHGDCSDGFYCDYLNIRVKWYIERMRKPDLCDYLLPVGVKPKEAVK